MKKLLSFLCLVGILFAFQAKLNAIPKYLVIDLETRASRYTDEAPDLRNDTCRTTELWLRYIPAGTFTMGSPVGEDGREDPSDETQHQVTLSQPYYIGVFEVTQAQWEAIMNFGAPIIWGGETIPARPSYFKNDEHYATRPVESVSYYMIRGEEAGIGWPNSDEVDDFCFMGLLRELTGLKFDLPTEAQWEYACRAGTTTALNSGKALFDPEDKVENMDAVGRYMYNSGFYKDFLDDEGNRELSVDEFGTAKVGSYAPNAWGLYDMHGNVVEWCLDWFYGDDYSTDDVTDPVGEEFDPDLEVSVCRGGSWCSEPYKCRSAFRGISNSYADDYENGFRLVCLTMPETHTVTVVNGTDSTSAKPSACGKLTADIVVNERLIIDGNYINERGRRLAEWTPINDFEGIFDGQNHIISGLYNYQPKGDSVGFFNHTGKQSITNKVEIKNLGFKDSYVKGITVGGFVGRAHSSIEISNSFFEGIIEGDYTSGFIGHASEFNSSSKQKALLSIKNCHNSHQKLVRCGRPVQEIFIQGTPLQRS